MDYFTGESTFKFCNGTNWIDMGGGGGGGALDASECHDGEQILFNASTGNAECPFDHLPDAFSFSDEDGAELSTEMESNIVQILNIDDGMEISVSGDGSPEYRICDDGTCSADPAFTSSAATIDDGQYIQLRLTSSADHESVYAVTVAIGEASEQWSVTTKLAFQNIDIISAYKVRPGTNSLNIYAYPDATHYSAQFWNGGGGPGGTPYLEIRNSAGTVLESKFGTELPGPDYTIGPFALPVGAYTAHLFGSGSSGGTVYGGARITLQK